MVTRSRSRLFVEGGGNDSHALKTECRKAFRDFLTKAGFGGRMPRIVACGGRQKAYETFSHALATSGAEEVVVLLVDSETPVADAAQSAQPWEHVRNRRGDGWEKPAGAADDNLHFMIQCMESWFLADTQAVASFFGQGFRQSSLPANRQIEEIAKADVLSGLKSAARNTQMGEYGKGAHSFKILALIDPAKVRSGAPYAGRLLQHLDEVL